MESGEGLTLQCVGGKTLPLPCSQESRVSDVRRLACNLMRCEQATLVAKGRSLNENDDAGLIREVLGTNGTVLAAPVRKAVQRGLHSQRCDVFHQLDGHLTAPNGGDIIEEETVLDDPAQAPEHASAVQAQMGSWMEKKNIPPAFLAVFYLLSLKQWSMLAIWMFGGPFAAAHGFGALYMGISLVTLICLNLGQRTPGEASAYSIFNDDFRRLPGDLTDDQVNNAFRGRI